MKRGLAHTNCVSDYDPSGSVRGRPTPCETQSSLKVSDPDAAHGHEVRHWSVEFDNCPVAFLAHKAYMRDRNNMTAMHPQKEGRI